MLLSSKSETCRTLRKTVCSRAGRGEKEDKDARLNRFCVWGFGDLDFVGRSQKKKRSPSF